MLHRRSILSFAPVVLLATSAVNAKPREAFDISSQVAPAQTSSARADTGGYAASLDEQRGAPRFFWANRNKPLPSSVAGMSLEALARHHLAEHAALYGLSPAALQSAHRTLLHDTGRGGIIQVFRQAIDGIDIFRSDM